MKDGTFTLFCVLFIVGFGNFLFGLVIGKDAGRKECAAVAEAAVVNRVAVEQCLEEVDRVLVVGQRLLVGCER